MTGDTNRRARSAAVVLALCFSLSTGLNADPHVVRPGELFLSGAYDSFLFPEADFQRHPSVLGPLLRPLTYLDLQILEDYRWKQARRLDDTIGAQGGVRREQDFFLLGALNLLRLTPSDNSVWGWGASGNSAWTHVRTELNDYDAFTQAEEHKTQSVPFTVGARVLWASKTPTVRTGLALDYGLAVSRPVFTWVTDATQDPTLRHVTYTGNDADGYGHTASLRSDWGGPLGNMDVTVALAYGFLYVNRDQRYRAVDTTGDGLKDTVKEYATWATGTDSGAPGAVSFAQEDRTFGHRVSADAVMRFLPAENLEMMLIGSYTPFDRSVRTYFTRIKTASILRDESWTSETRSQDWGNLSVGTVIGGRTQAGVDWRVGAKYGRSAQTLVLDGRQASGIKLFSRDNLGNYREELLGTDPPRGSIAGSGAAPSLEVDHQVTVKGGWAWQASNTVVLFSSLEVSGNHRRSHYRVFNLSTRTVWEETVGSMGLTWSALPRVGMIVPLGEKLRWVGDLTALRIPGAAGQSLDTVPYDLTVERATENGAVDLTQTGRVGWSATMKLSFQP